jgi:hypothetical protein
MKAIFKAKTSMRHLQLLSILSSPFLVARAFTVVPRHSLVQHHHHRASSTTLASDFGSDFGSAMPNLVSPYERIGINEDDLALGVDPGEFLTYIGTYVKRSQPVYFCATIVYCWIFRCIQLYQTSHLFVYLEKKI